MILGTWRIVLKWDDFDRVSEYIVEVVRVEHQSLVGHYVVGNVFTQDTQLTKLTGEFPIRCIEKMEKIT